MIKQEDKRSKPSDKFWYRVLFFSSLFLFILIIPPFFGKGIFSGHDILIHTIYIRAFENALLGGQFPVRWIEWFLRGYNQPTFNYYQPLFYYVVLIPRIFGFSYSLSLSFTIVAFWLLSGFFMFLFARRYFGNLGGMLSAIFYVFAPYHISDIFVRAALPEFIALTIIPAIFWANKSFFDTGKGIYLFFAAILTGALIISHSPIFIMFAPFIILYILYLFWENKKLVQAKFLFYSLSAFVIGFGAVSFFILPAVFEQKFIQSIFLQAGYYSFRNHFVCLYQLFSPRWGYGISTPDCNDGMSFQLGIANWLVVFFVVGFLLHQYKKKKFEKSYFLFVLFLSFIVISLYLTLFISLAIWEGVGLFSFIQYPWRFLALASFSASVMGGGVISLFKKESNGYLAYLILVVLVVVSSFWYLKPAMYIREEQLGIESKDFSKNKDINKEGFMPEIGYMPIWAQVLPSMSTIPKEGVKIIGGNEKANIKVVMDTPARKEYKAVSDQDYKLGFYVHYFPGWKLYINGSPGNISYDNVYGFIEFNVPRGEHKIVLRFENTPIRKTGNILSRIFFFLASTFLLVKKRT